MRSYQINGEYSTKSAFSISIKVLRGSYTSNRKHSSSSLFPTKGLNNRKLYKQKGKEK